MGEGKQDEGARGLCDLETAGRPGQAGPSNLLHWRVSLAVPVQKETRLRALTSPQKPSVESNGKRVILSDIVGRVSSGQMLALMGPSGAGKSSLLDCISLRNRRFTGMVYLNGKPAGDDFLSTTAYVHQEDLFFATLTVREHLTFHARVRMRRGKRGQSTLERVDHVLNSVGLAKCQDTLIGGPHSLIRGISGGERKRLSVATELLSDPDIIFADEPTSGLDAHMALSVCRILQELSFKGKVVVCAIHQPSSEIFELYSHLMLLSKGRTAYLGPRDYAIAYFGGLGYCCPKFYNPADFFIEDVVATTASDKEEGQRRVDKLVGAYADSALGLENRAWLLAETEKERKGGMGLMKTLSVTLAGGKMPQLSGKQYQASAWTQLLETYKRTIKSYAREPVLTRVRLVQAVSMGLVLGSVYLKQEQNAVRNKLGAMFLLITNQAIASAFTVAQAVPRDLPVFQREYMTGANRPLSWFLGLTMAEVPYQVLFPCIFGSITYWLIGLAPDPIRFFRFLLALVLMANASCSLGYFSSTLTGNDGIAVAIGPAMFLPMSLYVGVLHTASQIPPYFIPLDRISMIKYAFNAMVINEFSYKTYDPNLTKAVFKYLSIDPNDLDFNLGIIVAIMVGFRLAAYIFLCVRTWAAPH